MKMAAAAGYGDEQDRIEGSTAHDAADGDDSFSFESQFFESLIVPVLLRMQLSTEPPSSEGAMESSMDGVQMLSRQHDSSKDTMPERLVMWRLGSVQLVASVLFPMLTLPLPITQQVNMDFLLKRSHGAASTDLSCSSPCCASHSRSSAA